jgi:hypothetical protein
VPGIGDPALAGAMQGPDTVDGIAPAGTWGSWWQAQALAKRQAAPWRAAGQAETSADATTQGA